MSPVRRKILLAAAVFSLLALTGTILYFAFAQTLIRAAYEGTSLPFLNNLIAAHRSAEPDNHTLQYYLERGHWLHALGVLACVFGFLFTTALILRQQTQRLLTNYFTATSHPLNLAVFRVVIFGYVATRHDRAYFVQFAELPEMFLQPPVGTGWLLAWLPPDPALVSALYTLFIAACILTAFGLFTRASAVVAVITGIYVLGVPNFYGKVDHAQHILWFMALLAVSPCADALSVDALVRSWRGAKGRLATHLGYALPLRFAWLLIGLCYFFPGLWKLGATGFVWIFSDNFKYILYRQWFDKDFIPLLRLDQVPFLIQVSAALAVVFELSFVFLVLFPKLRPFAALAGFTFHNVTWYLMRIRFVPLQIAYVAFVDWHKLFTWLGSKLFRDEATLVFDSGSARIVRAVAALRVLDLFERVTYVGVRGEEASNALYFSASSKQRTGLGALEALCARVIGLWPLLPLLYVWRRISSAQLEVMSSREGNASALVDEAQQPTLSAPWRPTALVGTLLLVGVLSFGLLNVGHGWPFAAYPTFAGLVEPTLTRYEMVKLEQGGEVPLDLTPLSRAYGGPKFQTLVLGAISTEDKALQQEKLSSIWQLVAAEVKGVDMSDTGRFYSTTMRTDPVYEGERTVTRELLVEFKPTQRAAP